VILALYFPFYTGKVNFFPYIKKSNASYSSPFPINYIADIILTRKFSLLSEHEAISSTLEAECYIEAAMLKIIKKVLIFYKRRKNHFSCIKRKTFEYLMHYLCVCVCKKNISTTRKLKKKKQQNY
jgi:hypothetical protein